MNGTAGAISAWDSLEGVSDPLENPFLSGHEDALDHLASQFASGRMHHAWLLSGPRGIGKATLAAHFAGHVFRHPDPASAPSEFVAVQPGDAEQGKIAGGAHPNLLHLRRPWNADGKRWRTQLTVDEIRRVNHFFATSRGEDNWRIVIVDPADDLNANAANALLKILEEPPPRSLFFVLAQSPRGLLPTIRSRCRKLALRPLGEAALMRALAALGMGDDLSEEARTLLATLSGGSVRRAIVLIRSDGLALHQSMEALLAEIARPDWTAIHRLAGELAQPRNEDRYRLLLDLAHDRIARSIRGASAGEGSAGSDLSTLARHAEVWEKTRRSAALAQAFNLDRKQVVLNLFQAFHEAS